MELFHLLEKNEQRQIKIFQFLLKQPRVSEKEISQRLKIDRSTIREDVDGLSGHLMPFADKLQVFYDDNQLLLHRLGNVSASDIYYEYLKESVKYIILMNLLEHGSFQRQKLLTELNLSQATFTRWVKELNEDLVEFHVQIKNGRMEGPELQVRYFYFQLLWFGRPYLVNLQQFSQNAHDQILTFLNKQFNFPYTQDGKIKFEIWLYILQKRLRYGRHETLDYRDLPVHLLQESNFISLMQNTLLRFALQSAFAWNQYESLIFYLFMISSFTLDTTNHFVQDFLLQEKNNDTLVNGLTEQFENTMAHFLPFYTFSKDFSRKINLNVSQNHFRLVYMRGWISVFGRIGLQDRLAHFEDQNLLNLCQTLTDNSLNYLKLSQQDRDFSQVELFGRYASILQLIFKEVELRLQIACDFPYERLMQDIVIEMVRERLTNSVKWDLMKYDASSRYDVILSSQIKEYPNAHQAKIFVMLSNEFDFDFPYLNELLKATYLEKMQERMRQVPEFPLEAPLS